MSLRGAFSDVAVSVRYSDTKRITKNLQRLPRRLASPRNDQYLIIDIATLTSQKMTTHARND